MIATVYVTKADIKNGGRCSATGCPVALALKRRFKTNHVEVSHMSFSIGNQWFKRPENVEEFVTTMDREGKSKVRPIRFKVRISKSNIVLRSQSNN